MERKPLYINTPLIESRALSNSLGRTVYLKMEALQPTGSFKIRGIGLLCEKYAEQGARCFVSSSGGNAGLAAAYSGRRLGVAVQVIVPKTTLPMMRDKIALEGAEVLVHGEQWSDADELAHQLVVDDGVYYIPPFDHPLIWQGHASLVHEVAAAGVNPQAIVLSVGGGGLLSGVVQGLDEVGWPAVTLLAAETAGAASFAAALAADRVVSLEKISTIATSLGAKRVCEQAFLYTKTHQILSQIVTDRQAIEACCHFADDQQLLVEPACGAALALLYSKFPTIYNFDPIVVVVCGGRAVNLEMMNRWRPTSG